MKYYTICELCFREWEEGGYQIWEIQGFRSCKDPKCIIRQITEDEER